MLSVLIPLLSVKKTQSKIRLSLLGGDKGIREEQSDGIASEKAKESKEARGDFIEKRLKAGASVSPQGFAPKACTLRAKCGIPK